MINQQLTSAREILLKAGIKKIDDAVLLELIQAIKTTREALYEVGDFIYYREGMGESNHGWVTGHDDFGYKVKIWSPDTAVYPNYPTVVGFGDVISTATEADALDYYRLRTGQTK